MEFGDELIEALHNIIFHHDEFSEKEEKERINFKFEDFSGEFEKVDYSEKINKEYTKKDWVILLPKAYNFGDEKPHEIKLSEYTQNFFCYKLDPKNILKFLKKQNLQKEDLSLKTIRELLTTFAAPVECKKNQNLLIFIIARDQLEKIKVYKEKMKVLDEMKQDQRDELKERARARFKKAAFKVMEQIEAKRETVFSKGKQDLARSQQLKGKFEKERMEKKRKAKEQRENEHRNYSESRYIDEEIDEIDKRERRAKKFMSQHELEMESLQKWMKKSIISGMIRKAVKEVEMERLLQQKLELAKAKRERREKQKAVTIEQQTGEEDSEVYDYSENLYTSQEGIEEEPHSPYESEREEIYIPLLNHRMYKSFYSHKITTPVLLRSFSADFSTLPKNAIPIPSKITALRPKSATPYQTPQIVVIGEEREDEKEEEEDGQRTPEIQRKLEAYQYGFDRTGLISSPKMFRTGEDKNPDYKPDVDFTLNLEAQLEKIRNMRTKGSPFYKLRRIMFNKQAPKRPKQSEKALNQKRKHRKEKDENESLDDEEKMYSKLEADTGSYKAKHVKGVKEVKKKKLTKALGPNFERTRKSVAEARRGSRKSVVKVPSGHAPRSKIRKRFDSQDSVASGLKVSIPSSNVSQNDDMLREPRRTVGSKKESTGNVNDRSRGKSKKGRRGSSVKSGTSSPKLPPKKRMKKRGKYSKFIEKDSHEGDSQGSIVEESEDEETRKKRLKQEEIQAEIEKEKEEIIAKLLEDNRREEEEEKERIKEAKKEGFKEGLKKKIHKSSKRHKRAPTKDSQASNTSLKQMQISLESQKIPITQEEDSPLLLNQEEESPTTRKENKKKDLILNFASDDESLEVVDDNDSDDIPLKTSPKFLRKATTKSPTKQYSYNRILFDFVNFF